MNATAVSVEGGKVVLKGRESVDINGTVTAQKGSLGGQIHATANKVMLKSGAVIDASGAAGGGEVLVGGGWQGQDTGIANAQNTTAQAGARISADATQAGGWRHRGGMGGSGRQVTRTAADISARGGAAGGRQAVETSGKAELCWM